MSIATYFTVILNKIDKKHKRSFLTAKWKNLALINYEINPSILEKSDKNCANSIGLSMIFPPIFISVNGFLFYIL